jgi:hypothetical protein
MILSTLKQHLANLDTLQFTLENGDQVSKNFHVTEIGVVSKSFIDCGGTIRQENKINLQLWDSFDYDHRLAPAKLISIIELSQQKLQIPDAEIEVEFQQSTISKYGLDFNGKEFILTNTKTACLASDSCGVGEIKNLLPINTIKEMTTSCCTPGGGCC